MSAFLAVTWLQQIGNEVRRIDTRIKTDRILYMCKRDEGGTSIIFDTFNGMEVAQDVDDLTAQLGEEHGAD